MPKSKPKSKFDVYVGERIREARIAKKMSQTELGGLLGVSFQQVQKYETGRNRINMARVELLVSALNRPLSYFFSNVTDVRATANPILSGFIASSEGYDIANTWPHIPKKRRRVLLELIHELTEET